MYLCICGLPRPRATEPTLRLLRTLRPLLPRPLLPLSPSPQVFKGNVELKNLQLKPDALADLDLPVTVKAGLLGSLTLKASLCAPGGRERERERACSTILRLCVRLEGLPACLRFLRPMPSAMCSAPRNLPPLALCAESAAPGCAVQH